MLSGLKSLLSRPSQDQLDILKYDRITFEINVAENIPEISEEARITYDQDRQLTPDHPLYYEIFKKKEPVVETKQYTTKSNDSLIGIALKLNISENLLKQLNGFSGDNLFPNMRIKVPATADLSLLEENEQAPTSTRPKISELFQIMHQTNQISKYTVNYCAGGAGAIKGTLTLNPTYIMFTPLIDDPGNQAIFSVEKLLKWNAIIEIEDVQEVCALDLPSMSSEETTNTDQPVYTHIVQLLLYRVGNRRIEQKFKDRLKQLKIQQKSIASVSFKMMGATEQEEIITKKEIVEKIQEMIKKCKENQTPSPKLEKEEESKMENSLSRKRTGSLGTTVKKETEPQGLTNIPFFDILYQNIVPHKESSASEDSKDHPEKKHVGRRPSLINIKMTEESMLPHEGFRELASYFPLLYQLRDWSLVYSCMRNGTSFNTLMRLAKNKDPLLLLVKEYKGNIFGAFLVDTLDMGKTGRGEMFIFKYETIDHDETKTEISESEIKTHKLEVYPWTGKNEFFCFADSDGLGIGMGLKYGIYLNNTLERGQSAATHTFGNTASLSKHENFQIEDVEIWSLDDSES